MAWCALGGAMVAAVLVAVSGWGTFAALGLALFAIGVGLAAYRARADRVRSRLAGAAAAVLGSIALLLAGVKVVVVLAALRALETIFS